MSTKVDGSNMGPMQRKRSSSANEASKPINVLQIKQTYVDNKYNNSPHTSSLIFGRERCDSLPTRNRTSSESSNHSFTLPSGLLIGGSNARNISLTGGLRSHTYQRHSNSPPMNSTQFGCSESEESSISIDEPDDSCGFMPYRFNSRSSEGVIPEENTDDIGGSDSSTKYNDLSSQVDVATLAENYVNMAPVIAKSQKAMNTEHQQVKSVLSPEHQVSPHLEIAFDECAVDHVAKILSPDEETQMERPIRAYSIGSRNEHNRLFRQHMGSVMSSGTAGGGGGGGGNVYNTDTDHPSGRVRAFSVGSKARIPRCDLQRGVLKPKLLLEQQQLKKEFKDKHCHSNSSSNFNISSDMGLLSSSISSATTSTNAYNLKQLCTHRDKKSTSAPLLSIHKSQNSVDRMSDLMEIDFSIKQQQQQQQQKQKNSNSTNSRINLNTFTTAITATTTTPIMPTTIQQQPIIAATTTTTLLNKTYNSKCVPPTSYVTTTTTTQEMPSFTINSTMATTTNSSNSKYNLSSNNSIRKYNNKTTNVSKHQQQQPQITTTDNGYLEMKPVGINQQQTNVVTTNIKQQQQLKKQRSEQLHINQTPKITASTTTTTTTTAATISNKERYEQNDGYDVPPEIKFNKQQQIIMRNINANFTPTVATTTQQQQVTSNTKTTTTTTTTAAAAIKNTVLTNKSQRQQLQHQQQQEIELKSDNDNNHNNLEITSLNDENNSKQQQQQQQLIKKLTTTTSTTGKGTVSTILTSTPEKKYDLILDLEQENKQKKQECQINKNLVNINDDYANMERKFDAYIKLSGSAGGGGNENTNNNTAIITATSTSETTLKSYDNDKHVLTHSLSHDEKHNNQQQYQQQQQQQKNNRKSCGSTTTNINDISVYEMLQIKNNDKMLNQRIFTSIGNLKDNNNKIMITTTTTTTASTISRPRSTNSTLLHSLSTTCNNCVSNVSLSQPVTPTTTSITTITPIISTSSSACILTNSVVNAQNSKITPPPPSQPAAPPATSRPSSLNLETPHELHYASLDWPQCSSQEPTTTIMETNILTGGVGSGGVVVTNETVVLPTCTSVHNVYAKIDFDHSDSSSSSSKNI